MRHQPHWKRILGTLGDLALNEGLKCPLRLGAKIFSVPQRELRERFDVEMSPDEIALLDIKLMAAVEEHLERKELEAACARAIRRDFLMHRQPPRPLSSYEFEKPVVFDDDRPFVVTKTSPLPPGMEFMRDLLITTPEKI